MTLVSVAVVSDVCATIGRALKLVDVPTRLVLYPREGHQYVEPAHQIDVIRCTLELVGALSE